MSYFIYLRKSLIRDPKRHILLFITVTCAFILPLLISVYRDCSAYGMEQYLLDKTKGETYHISNAAESDMVYFENIPGLSAPRFKDETIYLSILSDEEWQNKETFAFYDNLIQKQTKLSGNEKLIISGYSFENAHGISTDDGGYISTQKLLIFIDLFIFLISSFMIRSAYKSHLDQFSSDIGILFSIGAEIKHIIIIFAFELAFIFLASSFCSVIFSVGLMKFLFKAFLEIKDINGLSWLLFHVEPQNILFHLLLFLCIFAFVFLTEIKKYRLSPIWEALHSEGDFHRKKQKLKKLKILSSPAASLEKIWNRRTNKTFRSCLWLSVPIMTVFLIIFSCITLNINSLSADFEYEIKLTVNDTETFGGFSEDDLKMVKSISGVDKIAVEYEIAPDKYIIEPDDPFSYPLPVRILRYSDYDPSKNGLSENEIAVCSDQNSVYNVGDTITLMLAEHYPENSGLAFSELTVAEFTDAKPVDWAIDLYLSDSFYNKIISTESINIVQIKLTDPSASGHVKTALQTYFTGAQYGITNRHEQIDAVLYASPGVYLLMLCLLFIIFLLITVVLYVKLCGYIYSSSKTIRSLYMIGASKRDIYFSYIKQDMKAAFSASVIPLLICIPIIMLISAYSDINGTPNAYILSIYTAAVLFILAAYLHPVHRTLRKIIKNI